MNRTNSILTKKDHFNLLTFELIVKRNLQNSKYFQAKALFCPVNWKVDVFTTKSER